MIDDTERIMPAHLRLRARTIAVILDLIVFVGVVLILLYGGQP